METNNPYEAPHHGVNSRRRFRVALSSTEIFTIGAVLAVLILLLFAPGQPHPTEYTAIENILIALTWNWLTIIVTILGFATLLAGAYHALGRIWYRFHHVDAASSESQQ